ncbi:TetR family transcriptional regulator [Saccharibacillus sp. O16]|nr:TetR family transcriptional regulator [Saccharibacillus sp. O16]
MEKGKATRESIVQTALDMVRGEGFEGLTIRKIADRSNTNVALINYYFGSKDRLLSEVIGIMLSGFRDSFEVLEDDSLPPEQRLKSFLLHYVQGIERHPELLLRIIMMGTGAGLASSQQEYGAFMRATGFDRIKDLLMQLTGEQDADRLMMMVMQIFGAVFMPILMKPLLEAGAGIEVPNVERQIDVLLERYL